MKIGIEEIHYYKKEIDSCKNCIYKDCLYYGNKNMKCDKYIKDKNYENRTNY